MNRPITYALHCGGAASAGYYPAISSFTDHVLKHAEESIMPIARLYRMYIIHQRLEEPRSEEEYTFELLNFGILWRVYGETAVSIAIAPFHFLAFLADIRKKHRFIKTGVDPLRGVLLSLFLRRKDGNRTEYLPRSTEDIERLMLWLEATGDFREDAFRLIRWRAFLESQSTSQYKGMMEKIFRLSDWFENESRTVLGNYTLNVETFLAEKSARYRWREDQFSCLRTRVEYHLNMVGAEIMNRAFRQQFLSSERKTVLLPGCMRIRTAGECEGIKTKDGIQCTGCEARCNVNRLRILGLRNNFRVCILPHSTDLSRWAAKPGAPSHAVVGVACLSVLVQGGWELKRWGVPAQCVLLNQCGCEKHWTRQGFPTELDIRELKRIIQEPSLHPQNLSEQPLEEELTD